MLYKGVEGLIGSGNQKNQRLPPISQQQNN